jgi:hypothetical protein
MAANTPAPNYVFSKSYGWLCTTGRPQGYGRAVSMANVITSAARRGSAAAARGAQA